MHWAIGITTSGRPSGNDLLTPTVRSFKAAGWDDLNIYVFREPNALDTDEDVVTIHNEKQLGPWANWRTGLSRLLELEPGAEMYVLLQDDLQFRPRLRTYMERTIWRNADGTLRPAAYSPYTSKKDCIAGPDGWFVSRSGWQLCGACSFVFTAELAKIMNCQLPPTVPHNRHIDAHVGKMLLASQYELLCHRPSLVEHLADADSTCGHRSNPSIRTSRGFIDEPLQPGLE